LVLFNSDWIGYTDVASSGSLNFYDTQGTVKRSVPLPQTLVSEERFICKLSDALVFVLHGKTGQAEILNAATGTLQQVRVDEADVASSLANYDPKDRSHADIITSAVGDNKGHVFLCFSGIKYTEGALIVKLDSSGSVVHRYRCSLPTRTKFVVPGNPSGAMTPSLIAILDNQLFILDRKGFVSKYLIP
jgi:hypothetical protein